MRPIIQLDQLLINKIAAGEVVERPLNVVKELTENSIDAGATSLTVEITDGGLAMIRITDNGGGISQDQLQLAFSRHATSKIATAEELFRVSTLGFRGEALSSIAAVSQVEMVTKTADAVLGTKIKINGGQIQPQENIGCANGTTVVVSNLFFNTPARRKFLKKPSVEAGYISDCMQKLALANPSLTLRYISNGKIIFQTNGNGDMKNVMLNIYGRETATKVLPLDTTDGVMQLYGLVGKPETARANRSHGSFFINGRYIKSRLLSNAIEQAMRTMLPIGKFPLYALNLQMPYDMLDVNVHPTKMDVRFAEEEAVHNFIENAVRECFKGQNLIPNVVSIEKAPTKEPKKEPEQLRIPTNIPDVESFVRDMYVNASKAAPAKEKSDTKIFASEPPPIEIEPPKPELKSAFSNYQLHCLVFQTYWIVTQEDSLYLIDQHAAHERILYENLLAKAREKTVASQQLLLPISLHLTANEQQLLEDNVQLFENFGFALEKNEYDVYAIIAVPLLLNGPISSGFFTDILDKIDQVGFTKQSLYDHKLELIAMASCKAAVKGGDTISETEARAIITQLLTMENPFTCPHGRPTIIEYTKAELMRRFKRS